MGKTNISFKNKKGGNVEYYKKVVKHSDNYLTVTNDNRNLGELYQKAEQLQQKVRDKERNVDTLKAQQVQQNKAVEKLKALLIVQEDQAKAAQAKLLKETETKTAEEQAKLLKETEAKAEAQAQAQAKLLKETEAKAKAEAQAQAKLLKETEAKTAEAQAKLLKETEAAQAAEKAAEVQLNDITKQLQEAKEKINQNDEKERKEAEQGRIKGEEKRIINDYKVLYHLIRKVLQVKERKKELTKTYKILEDCKITLEKSNEIKIPKLINLHEAKAENIFKLENLIIKFKDQYITKEEQNIELKKTDTNLNIVDVNPLINHPELLIHRFFNIIYLEKAIEYTKEQLEHDNSRFNEFNSKKINDLITNLLDKTGDMKKFNTKIHSLLKDKQIPLEYYNKKNDNANELNQFMKSFINDKFFQDINNNTEFDYIKKDSKNPFNPYYFAVNEEQLNKIMSKLMFIIVDRRNEMTTREEGEEEEEEENESYGNPIIFSIKIKNFLKNLKNKGNFVGELMTSLSHNKSVSLDTVNIHEVFDTEKTQMSELVLFFYKRYKTMFEKAGIYEVNSSNNQTVKKNNRQNLNLFQNSGFNISKLFPHNSSDHKSSIIMSIIKLQRLYLFILETMYIMCISIENNKLFLQIQSLEESKRIETKLIQDFNLNTKFFSFLTKEDTKQGSTTLQDMIDLFRAKLYTNRFRKEFNEYHKNIHFAPIKLKDDEKETLQSTNPKDYTEIINTTDKGVINGIYDFIYSNFSDTGLGYKISSILDKDKTIKFDQMMEEEYLNNIYFMIMYFREMLIQYTILYKLDSSSKFKQTIYKSISTKIYTFIIIRDEGNETLKRGDGQTILYQNPKKIFFMKKIQGTELKELTMYHSSDTKLISNFTDSTKITYDKKMTVSPIDGVYYNQGNESIGTEIKDKIFIDDNKEKDIFIFGYGMSGAGKTSALIYKDITLENKTKEKKPGLIKELISKISETTAGEKIYLECYEFYYRNRTPEKLTTQEYTKSEINELCEMLKFLFTDQSKRKIAFTPNNPVSSRSHCIAVIYFEKGENDKPAGQKLIIGDLAGSENTFNDKSLFIHKEQLTFKMLEDKTNKEQKRSNLLLKLIETKFKIEFDKIEFKFNTTKFTSWTKMALNYKYSDFTIQNCIRVKISLYDSNVKLYNRDLQLNGLFQEDLLIEYNDDNKQFLRTFFYNIMSKFVLYNCLPIKDVSNKDVSNKGVPINKMKFKSGIGPSFQANDITNLQAMLKITAGKNGSDTIPYGGHSGLIVKYNEKNNVHVTGDLTNIIQKIKEKISTYIQKVIDEGNVLSLLEKDKNDIASIHKTSEIVKTDFETYFHKIMYKKYYFHPTKNKSAISEAEAGTIQFPIQIIKTQGTDTDKKDFFVTSVTPSLDDDINIKMIIYHFIFRFKNILSNISLFDIKEEVERKMDLRNAEGNYINQKLVSLKKFIDRNTYKKENQLTPFLTENSHACSPYIYGCLKKLKNPGGHEDEDDTNCEFHDFLKYNMNVDTENLLYVIALVINNQFKTDDNKKDMKQYQYIDDEERIIHETQNIDDKLKMIPIYDRYTKKIKKKYDEIINSFFKQTSKTKLSDALSTISDENSRTSIGIIKEIFALSKGGVFLNTYFKYDNLNNELSRLIHHHQIYNKGNKLNDEVFLCQANDHSQFKSILKLQQGGLNTTRKFGGKKIRKTRKKGNIIKKRFRFNKKNRKQSRLT